MNFYKFYTILKEQENTVIHNTKGSNSLSSSAFDNTKGQYPVDSSSPGMQLFAQWFNHNRIGWNLVLQAARKNDKIYDLMSKIKNDMQSPNYTKLIGGLGDELEKEVRSTINIRDRASDDSIISGSTQGNSGVFDKSQSRNDTGFNMSDTVIKKLDSIDKRLSGIETILAHK